MSYKVLSIGFGVGVFLIITSLLISFLPSEVVPVSDTTHLAIAIYTAVAGIVSMVGSVGLVWIRRQLS